MTSKWRVNMPKMGSKIEGEVNDIDDLVEGEVLGLLNTQFTALVAGKVRFYFYKDHGDTWIGSDFR